MLQSKKGTTNGFYVMQFDKGETYEVETRLANLFIRDGWAVDPTEPEEVELCVDS